MKPSPSASSSRFTGRYAASSGASIRHGLELALEETNRSQRNSRQIRFVIVDDQSTVEGAVEAYNKLIQDGVPAILGPATSSQTEAAYPVAQAHGVVAMSPTSTARGLSALGDYLFRAALTTDVVIPSGIETTYAKLGYQTAATLYDDTDVFSTDSDLAVRETLAAKGVELLITETFRGGDTDFTAQLTRIKETNPDVIFVSAQAPEKPGILTQGRQVGIPVSVPFIVRTLTMSNVEASGDAAEGAITFVGWASTADTSGNQAFVQNYSEKYGGSTRQLRCAGLCCVQRLSGSDSHRRICRFNRHPRRTSKYYRPRYYCRPSSPLTLMEMPFTEPKILIVENGELQIFE